MDRFKTSPFSPSSTPSITVNPKMFVPFVTVFVIENCSAVPTLTESFGLPLGHWGFREWPWKKLRHTPGYKARIDRSLFAP